MAFSDRLGVTKKVDNHDASYPDKVELRERVLEAIGPAAVHVFDAYAGSGQMHAAVWRRAASYVGVDQKFYPGERLMFVHDCKRVMRQIDLQPFTVFDFDAYGSPWENCCILAARRRVAPGERIGILLTEGSGLKLKFGGLPGAMSNLTGMDKGVAGAMRGNKELASRAIRALAKRMRCSVEKTWRAERLQGSMMLYFGIVLVGELGEIGKASGAAPVSATPS